MQSLESNALEPTRAELQSLPLTGRLWRLLPVYGLPIAAFYVLAIALVLWIVAEYLPIGRNLYAIGANPRAAELNGIRSRRFVIGAFLGSTTIKPGRVNVWGTVVGVIILAVGISGIQQMGGAFYVEPLFNGATLLIAIGIAGYAQRKRSSVRYARRPGQTA